MFLDHPAARGRLRVKIESSDPGERLIPVLRFFFFASILIKAGWRFTGCSVMVADLLVPDKVSTVQPLPQGVALVAS